MKETKILIIGTTFLLIGAVIIGMALIQPQTQAIPYGFGVLFILAGAALSVFGILGFAGVEFAKRDSLYAGNLNVFSVGLIRCMIAMSVADNVLADSEIKQIQKIYKHLIQQELAEQIIRDTAGQMMDDGISIENEIKTLSNTLSKANKEKLVIASLYILAADNDKAESELIMLDDIRLGLGLSLSHVEKIKEDFFEGRDLTTSG